MMRILTLSGLIGCLSVASGAAQTTQLVLVAIDSTGKTVGAMTGDGLVALQLKPNEDVVQTQVKVDHIGAEGSEYYANSTCTGAVFLKSRALIPNAYLKQGDPGTIIFADVTTALQQVESVKFVSICHQGPDMAYPARQASIGEQQWTPPFSVKFQ